MKNQIKEEMDWTNRYHVIGMTQEAIYDIVDTVLNEYEDIDEDNFHDALWETVDNHSFVIYTYNAKRIAETFELDPFEVSEYFEERYNSWNEMAFEVLYTRAQEKLIEQLTQTK